MSENVEVGDPGVDRIVSEWLAWDKNEASRSAILSLCKERQLEQLRKLLLSRLAFGTAGLRGRMGPGYSQMNDLVIIQTAQGFTVYLESALKDVLHKGVVIGYDGRYNSKRWAELSAAILLNRGIPVYLFSKVCPTPFVAFSVSHFGCAAGIMVTASHNPKDDNGYKVYWNNGAQIISPHDKGIQSAILENLEPWDNSWDTSILSTSSDLKDPLQEVMDSYFSILKDTIPYPEMNAACTMNFTYTPMHGVGYPYMIEAFKVASLKPFIVVEEQKDPDPEFPTVKFPNPEEGKSALDLAIVTAEKNKSTVILANDPDADRLAAAERHNGENGPEWHVFTGNELGALLGWWAWHTHCKQCPTEDPSNVYMLSSTVSSKILKTIADAEGFNFFETLTGFKWLGNKALELEAQNKKVLFAFEEAIGFMFGTAVVDKDGISAAIHVAELVAYLSNKGKKLRDLLHDIYVKYGYHVSHNSYYVCYEKQVIDTIFDRLRNFKGKPNTYPEGLLEGRYTIKSVRDLTTGYDSSQPDYKAILPVSKSSQMITFNFTNGLVATLRTSGTEPKIKYYTELCASPSITNVEEVKATITEMVEAIKKEFLEPEKNGLIPKEGD